MIIVLTCVELLVIVATLITMAATMVVVLVEVMVAGLLIFSHRSVSNMAILLISVITDLTPPISLMNLWCCMILLHCNLCSIVAHSQANSKPNTWVNPANTKSQNQPASTQATPSAIC